MTDRSKVLKTCIKEVLVPVLQSQSFAYDGKYTFRFTTPIKETVKIIEFQPGTKWLNGKFTVNLGIYSTPSAAEHSAPNPEHITTGFCQVATRLGCTRKIGKFWLKLFGQPDTWWKQILYKPRDIWWEFSEDKNQTMASVRKCATLIKTVGLEWLEQRDNETGY